MNRLKILFDIILNILASALPVVALQMLVFPFIASRLNENSYGLMIAIYSLLNIIPASIGTTLNNTRLLHDTHYRKLQYNGDFPILAIFGSILNLVGMFIALILLEDNLSIVGVILFLIISIETLIHDYLIVEFRIKLNYKFILFDRITLTLGYIIGALLFYLTDVWYYPFIVGQTFSLLYVLKSTSIWKEKVTRTPLFEVITKESFYFLISTILLRITSYADKLLLYPLLGGNAVSIYYAATILSKVITLAITPMNSVVLSYLSRITNKPNELFWKVFFFSCGICLFGYFTSIFISESLLYILYPMFIDDAMQYIYITSATTVLNVLASIIQPFVLKYSSMKYQIVINLFDVILYTLLSLILLTQFGLKGFCIGVMLSRILKVMLLLMVYVRSDSEFLTSEINTTE